MLSDVQLQNALVPCADLSRIGQCHVGSKAAFEDWFHDVRQGVVNDPVAEGRGGHQGRFRVNDSESAVRARALSVPAEFAL